MPLSSGTRLGSYEITHVLGAGGMGEVYRARDSKLGRSVAIKIILGELGADADRVARFEREAKVKDKRTAPFGGVRADRPTDGIFSPDGKWVAYTSDGTVYVQPFPATGAKYEIPKAEAAVPHHPLWSSSNTLVINQRPGTLDVVTVTTSPAFSFGNPVSGPRKFQTGPPSMRRAFDVMPDGRLVGLIEQGDVDNASALRHFTVVLNWFEELKARVPGR